MQAPTPKVDDILPQETVVDVPCQFIDGEWHYSRGMVVDCHGLLELQGAYDAMANTVFHQAMGMMKRVEENKKQKEEKRNNKCKFNEWKANTVRMNTLSNWKKSLTSTTSPTAPTPSKMGEPKPKKAKKPKSSPNPGKAPAAFDEHTHKPTKKPK
jgi:hypothetical protein